MTYRAFPLLAAFALSFALISPPMTAQAAGCPIPFYGIFCAPLSLLDTAYGPIARAFQVSPGGNEARYGNYSLLRDEFLPLTDWAPIHSTQEQLVRNVWATDGISGTIRGYGSVDTEFGPATWGVQFADFGSLGVLGRFGIYNFLSNTFYPEGDWRAPTTR